MTIALCFVLCNEVKVGGRDGPKLAMTGAAQKKITTPVLALVAVPIHALGLPDSWPGPGIALKSAEVGRRRRRGLGVCMKEGGVVLLGTKYAFFQTPY